MSRKCESTIRCVGQSQEIPDLPTAIRWLEDVEFDQCPC